MTKVKVDLEKKFKRPYQKIYHMKGHGESCTACFVFPIQCPATSQWCHEVSQNHTLHEYVLKSLTAKDSSHFCSNHNGKHNKIHHIIMYCLMVIGQRSGSHELWKSFSFYWIDYKCLSYVLVIGGHKHLICLSSLKHCFFAMQHSMTSQWHRQK